MLYSRDRHNIVNELYFNKMNFLKRGGGGPLPAQSLALTLGWCSVGLSGELGRHRSGLPATGSSEGCVHCFAWPLGLSPLLFPERKKKRPHFSQAKTCRFPSFFSLIMCVCIYVYFFFRKDEPIDTFVKSGLLSSN